MINWSDPGVYIVIVLIFLMNWLVMPVLAWRKPTRKDALLAATISVLYVLFYWLVKRTTGL